jgi:hypothetical protein
MTRLRHALAALLVTTLLSGSDAVSATGASAPAATAGRLAQLLAQPALRALPESPSPRLAGEQRLDDVAFADAAGVVALQWPGHVRVVDVGTGAMVGDFALEAAGPMSLSPNGRVLAVGAGGHRVVLHAAETGEELATLPDVRGGRLVWLGEHAVAYVQAGDPQLVVRDLAAGLQARLPFDGGDLAGAAPVPGRADRFVVVSSRRIAQVEVPADAVPRLVRDVERPGKSTRSSDDVAPGPDGTVYFGSGTAVSVLDPATLAISEWSFAPLHILRAGPLPDADRVLVSLSGGARVRGAYVYSRSRHTLAPVGVVPGGVERLRYQPGLRRLLAMDDGKAALLDEVPTGAATEVVALVEQMEFEVATNHAETSERLDRYGETLGSAMTLGTGRFTQRKPAPAGTTAAAPSRQGRERLAEAVRAGHLRVGDHRELVLWKRAYEAAHGHAVPEAFNKRIVHAPVYVVVGEFAIPAELGDNEVVFVRDRPVASSQEVDTRAPVLVIATGGCDGALCRRWLPGE